MENRRIDHNNYQLLRKPRVGIFRLQLFKPSEGFITAQGDALRQFEPVYIGRKIYGDPNGRLTALPKPESRLNDLLLKARMLLLQDPRPFLRVPEVNSLGIIHAHFAIDGVYALKLAERLNVPLVTTLHGFDVTRSEMDMLRTGSPNLIHGVLKMKQLKRRGDLFICVSDFIKRKAIERGFPEEALTRHYIGIDCKKLQPRKGPGEPSLIVHVARLVEKKGTEYLLHAFSHLAKRDKKLRLAIIGEGPRRQDLEALAQNLGIAQQCEFLGVQPNSVVLDWTARAAVQVVSSVRSSDGDMEGFGIVNIEAGAQAVPIVAFESGGISEAVRHNVTGLLVPERDVEGLAHSIWQLVSNEDMRLRFGAEARAYVESEFNIESQTRELEAIYEALIERWLNGRKQNR